MVLGWLWAIMLICIAAYKCSYYHPRVEKRFYLDECLAWGFYILMFWIGVVWLVYTWQ